MSDNQNSLANVADDDGAMWIFAGDVRDVIHRHTSPNSMLARNLEHDLCAVSQHIPYEPGGNEASREAQLLQEVAKLRAIVDRLPKTADGVPLAPGDRCYWWASGEAVVPLCYDTDYDKSTSCGVPEGGGPSVSLAECYATPEASDMAMRRITGQA